MFLTYQKTVEKEPSIKKFAIIASLNSVNKFGAIRLSPCTDEVNS